MPSRSLSHEALRLAIFASLALFARETVAGELAYEVSAGGGHSDNLTRVADDGVEETIAAVGMRLSYDELSKRVDADVVADFDYYDYLDDTYDSEIVGSLIANSRFALIEDRLHWTLNDNFGQVVLDPFSPATPENRENVNYLDTGLETTFAFGSQTRMDLGVAYAAAHYEESPLNSDALIGELALRRLPSDSTSLGLHAQFARVEYDDNVFANNDYDQSELYGQYSIHGARTVLDAAVGYTEMEREDGTSDSGPLVRLSLQRLVANMSTLRLNAGQEFANSASAFASSQGDSVGQDTSTARQTGTPFKRRYGDLAWLLTGRRTSFELSAGLEDQVYDEEPELDQSLTRFHLRLRRNLTAAFEVSLSARVEQVEFEQGDFNYDDLIGNLGLNWQMSRRLALLFNYDYVDREQNAFGGGYSENRLWLTLAYRYGEPRDSMRGAFTQGAE